MAEGQAVAGIRRRAWQLAQLIGLFLLAYLLRSHQLHDIPAYTDETNEIQTAIEIAFEGARPLVHSEAYRGPLWAYGLAGALELFGPSPRLPRTYAMWIGLLTVLATYGFGRVLAGHGAGMIAGLLQATAFSPVVLESHVAWSNHSAPLMVLLAGWLTWRGGGRGGRDGDALPNPRFMALAGLAWGLALQVHPSVIPPLAGAGLWLLWQLGPRTALRSRAIWLAAALLLVGYSPVLIHNAQSLLVAGRIETLVEATEESQPINRDFGPLALARNYGGMLGQLGRAAVAGRPPDPGDPSGDDILDSWTMLRKSWTVTTTDRLRLPIAAVAALVLVSALLWALRKGPRLAAAMAIAGLLVLPLINRSWLNFYDMRYLGFVLPLAFIAIGARTTALEGAWRRAAVGLVLLMLAYPWFARTAFYTRELELGRSNGLLGSPSRSLAYEGWSEGQPIWIDKALRDIDLGGGGDPARALRMELQLSAMPSEFSDVDELRWFLENDDSSHFWMFLHGSTHEQLVGEGYDLVSLRDNSAWHLVLRRGVELP